MDWEIFWDLWFGKRGLELKGKKGSKGCRIGSKEGGTGRWIPPINPSKID